MNLKHIFLYLGVISAFLSAPMAVQGAAAAPRTVDTVDGRSSVTIDPATTRLLPGYYSKSWTSGYTVAPMLAGVGVLAHIARFGLSHYLKRVESERAALLEKELKGDTPLTIEEDTRLQKLHTNRKTLQKVITILRGGGYSLLFVATLVYFMTRNKYKTVEPYVENLTRVLAEGKRPEVGRGEISPPRVVDHDNRFALGDAGREFFDYAGRQDHLVKDSLLRFARHEMLYGAEGGNPRLDERLEWARRLSAAEDKIKYNHDSNVVGFIQELFDADRPEDVIDLYENHFSDDLKKRETFLPELYRCALLRVGRVDDVFSELNAALTSAENVQNTEHHRSHARLAGRMVEVDHTGPWVPVDAKQRAAQRILPTLCQLHAAGHKKDGRFQTMVKRFRRLFGAAPDSSVAMPGGTRDAYDGGGAPGGTIGADAGNEPMTDALSHTLRVSETAELVCNCLSAADCGAGARLDELAAFIRPRLRGERKDGLPYPVQSIIEYMTALPLLRYAYEEGPLAGRAHELRDEFTAEGMMDDGFYLRRRANSLAREQRSHDQLLRTTFARSSTIEEAEEAYRSLGDRVTADDAVNMAGHYERAGPIQRAITFLGGLPYALRTEAIRAELRRLQGL